MKRFSLAGGVIPNGDQLCAEVLAATGVDLSERLRFVPPDTIEVSEVDALEAEIAALIAAHVPTPPVVDLEIVVKIDAARQASLKPRAERTLEDIHTIAEAFALVVPPVPQIQEPE